MNNIECTTIINDDDDDNVQELTDLIIAKKMVNIFHSAKSRNLEFDISFKKMKQLLTRKTCFFTGIPFEENGDNQRTIDRVDNNKGYIDSNVVTCTKRINSIKGNITINEINILHKKINEFILNQK